LTTKEGRAMARSNLRGRRALAAAVAVAAALAMGACSGDGSPGPGTTTPADSHIGGAPPLTPAPASTGAPSPSQGGGNNAPLYPRAARAYAQELLKAWAGPDYTRLSQLAVQSAVQQIRDSIKSGGKPNAQWTHVSCGAAESPGFTRCVFRNAHGDETGIVLKNSQLGFPAAVTEAPLDRTEYRDQASSYIDAFISAWQQGNHQRMARLSSTSIKNYFVSEGSALAAYGMNPPVKIDGGYVTIQINDMSFVGGQNYVLRVLAEPGGEANGIKGYCKGIGCTPS
jgi:hypothetical protein